MIAKGIPGQLVYHAMILMHIMATVGKDPIWVDFPLQPFKTAFDLSADIGEKAILKRLQLDLCVPCLVQKNGLHWLALLPRVRPWRSTRPNRR